MELNRIQAAEAMLVAAVASEPSMLHMARISPGDFTDKRLGKIYAEFCKADGRGHTVDFMLVAESLGAKDGHDMYAYVMDVCTNTACSPANAEAYAKKIHEHKREMEVIKIGRELMENPKNADEVSARLMDVNAEVDTDFDHTPQAVAAMYNEEYEKKANGEMDGVVEPGYDALKFAYGQFEPGQLYFIGGRPGSGKTAMGCCLTAKAFVRGKHGEEARARCGWISAEMRAPKLMERFYSIMSGLPSNKLRDGELNDGELTRLTNVQTEINDWPLWVNDKPDITPAEVMAQAIKWKHDKDKGLDILFVDYLQFLTPNERDREKRNEIAGIGKGLWMVARKLNIPVVCMVQLNREAETEVPRMDHIGDSGELERMVHACLMLHVTDKQAARTRPVKEVEGIVVKNRNGPEINMMFNFYGGNYRFREVSEGAEPQQQGTQQPGLFGEGT